jgi:hypothetical protein
VACPSPVAAQDEAPPAFEPPLAQLRGPTLPVPSDGALVFVSSDGSVPAVEVRGPDGALLEGTMLLITEEAPVLHAWVPAMELPLGTLAIAILDPFGSSATSASVEVVPPFAPGLPELNVEPSASWVMVPDSSDCCSTPLGEVISSTCFVTRYSTSIRVQPGFSSPEPQSVLNQYLFRVMPVSPLPSDRDLSISSFRPLESAGQEVVFYDAADEYCIEVHARHIATGKEEVYSSRPSCVSHDERNLGVYLEAEVDPRALSVFGCLRPPFDFEAEWCEINEGACGIDDEDACDLYNYNCKNGPLPRVWKEIVETQGLAGTESTAERDSCSVARLRSSSGVGASLGAMLALFAICRRRFGQRWR